MKIAESRKTHPATLTLCALAQMRQPELVAFLFFLMVRYFRSPEIAKTISALFQGILSEIDKKSAQIFQESYSGPRLPALHPLPTRIDLSELADSLYAGGGIPTTNREQIFEKLMSPGQKLGPDDWSSFIMLGEN
jgi:hypothetical protein